MRFDCSKRGLLAADVAWFRDYFFDPHMISFRPGSGGEGDGRPLLCEAEIEPGRLVWGHDPLECAPPADE